MPIPSKGTAVEVDSILRQDDAAAAVVSGSWLLRTLERLFQLVPAAWEASAARSTLATLFWGPGTTVSQSLRMAGWALLSATTVHLLLVGVRDLLKPPMTGVIWIVAIPLALALVCLPDAFVAAWRSSRTLRGRSGDSSACD